MIKMLGKQIKFVKQPLKVLLTFCQKLFEPDFDGIARFSIFLIHPPGKDFCIIIVAILVIL